MCFAKFHDLLVASSQVKKGIKNGKLGGGDFWWGVVLRFNFMATPRNEIFGHIWWLKLHGYVRDHGCSIMLSIRKKKKKKIFPMSDPLDRFEYFLFVWSTRIIVMHACMYTNLSIVQNQPASPVFSFMSTVRLLRLSLAQYAHFHLVKIQFPFSPVTKADLHHYFTKKLWLFRGWLLDSNPWIFRCFINSYLISV